MTDGIADGTKLAGTVAEPAQGDAGTVYVDEPIFPFRGANYCHMFSEDLDALHRLAANIGLRRSWFQRPPKASWPHYDLSPTKRRAALGAGAVSVDRYQATIVARKLRGTLTDEWLQLIEKMRKMRAS